MDIINLSLKFKQKGQEILPAHIFGNRLENDLRRTLFLHVSCIFLYVLVNLGGLVNVGHRSTRGFYDECFPVST